MWYTENKPPTPTEIRREHVRILTDAIQEEDPNTLEVHESLAALEKEAMNKSGFKVYRKWLNGEGEIHYHKGLEHIKRQFRL